MNKQTVEEDLLGDAEIIASPSNTDTSVKNLIVDEFPEGGPASPQWDEFVMSHFVEGELTEQGYPYSHGLRRVARLLLGPTTFNGVTQVFPPNEKTERATVVWRVDFRDNGSFADVADSSPENSDDAFIPFAVACAATRAESRALRKALSLRRVAAEEVTSKNTAEIGRQIAQRSNVKTSSTGEYDESGSMTDAQSNFLSKKCQQLNINVERFLKDVMKFTNSRISKRQASNAIDKLNELQQDVALIDGSIQGFNSDWRK